MKCYRQINIYNIQYDIACADANRQPGEEVDLDADAPDARHKYTRVANTRVGQSLLDVTSHNLFFLAVFVMFSLILVFHGGTSRMLTTLGIGPQYGMDQIREAWLAYQGDKSSSNALNYYQQTVIGYVAANIPGYLSFGRPSIFYLGFRTDFMGNLSSDYYPTQANVDTMINLFELDIETMTVPTTNTNPTVQRMKNLNPADIGVFKTKLSALTSPWTGQVCGPYTGVSLGVSSASAIGSAGSGALCPSQYRNEERAW